MKTGLVLLLICVSVVQYFYFRNKINSVYGRLENLCFDRNAFVLRDKGYVCIPCEDCRSLK